MVKLEPDSNYNVSTVLLFLMPEITRHKYGLQIPIYETEHPLEQIMNAVLCLSTCLPLLGSNRRFQMPKP